ncbi:hypothetical protein jhhlp_000535 [Lomentospora prolificans]|uniref:Uncharacterized protein n=1 Tax=Lomentospora prolificans TaxID=41688 RepID=A0A2N3NL70_9PEZI|nr:hypothetical protein jhhlp_000535 [Lomentospora prolificans]
MSIINAVEDLVKSIYELFVSVFGGAAHIIQSFLSAIIGFFTGLINMSADVLNGVVDVVGGVGRFVLGNIVVLGIIAAGGYLYLNSQQRQRGPVTATKKTT